METPEGYSNRRPQGSMPGVPEAGNTSPEDEAALIAFVSDRDVACPACKYNLRALVTPRCPECGEALVLRVGLQEAKLGPWLLTSVPLLMMGGLGLLICITALGRGRWPRMGGDDLIAWMFVTALPFAAAAVAFRRRFVRLSVASRRGLAILSIGYALVAGLAVVLMSVR